MLQQKQIRIPPKAYGFHLITNDILSELGDLPEQGFLHLHLQHTSAALTLNENADPSVRTDLRHFISRLIPEDYPGFTHTMEGADDMPAHIKSSLFGVQLWIPVKDSRLQLGTWQGIYLCEFRRNAGSRNIFVSMLMG